MAVSTTVGIEVEAIQFGCWVFLETQEINFRDTESKYDKYCIFLRERFSS